MSSSARISRQVCAGVSGATWRIAAAPVITLDTGSCQIWAAVSGRLPAVLAEEPSARR